MQICAEDRLSIRRKCLRSQARESRRTRRSPYAPNGASGDTLRPHDRGWPATRSPRRGRRVAEREGFEPPIRLPVCRISSAVRSTTLPPLRGGYLGHFRPSGNPIFFAEPARALVPASSRDRRKFGAWNGLSPPRSQAADRGRAPRGRPGKLYGINLSPPNGQIPPQSLHIPGTVGRRG